MLTPTDKPQRIAIYARVSSEEQAEANTIQNQINYAERYVDLNSLHVAETYLDDGVSGTIPLAERQGGHKLLADAKAGKVDVVLVYRVDRLARRLKVLLDAHETLQAAGVGLRSMTEPIDSTTPIGRFIFQLLGSIAELERETILERMILGANRTAAEGKWLGGIVPYGYRVNTGRFLEVCEDKLPGFDLSEADVIRLCYRLLVEDGYSTYRIADHLNALGIPPSYTKDGRQMLQGKRKAATSGQWLPSRVRNMLAQTIYKGLHYYGLRTNRKREPIPRTFPAIVSAETWERAQVQMKANHRWLSPQNSLRFYLLRGLIKCDLCGLTYVGTPGSKRETAYYKCNGKHSYRGKLNGRCPSKPIPAEDTEKAVWEDIKSFCRDPGPTLRQFEAQLRDGTTVRQTVEQDLAVIIQGLQKKQRERETIIALLRKEIITYAEGERELAQIATESKALESQRDDLFAQLQENLNVEHRLIGAEAMLRELQDKIESADNVKKRQIVETLVKEIRVETVGEGRKRQARIKVSFVFGEAVARTSNPVCYRLQIERVWAIGPGEANLRRAQ